MVYDVPEKDNTVKRAKMNNNIFNPFASVSQEQIQEVMKPITKTMLEDLEKGKGKSLDSN